MGVKIDPWSTPLTQNNSFQFNITFFKKKRKDFI